MIQVMVWWLLLGAFVIFCAGGFIGAVVMACCSAAGCTDCRLAAKPAQIYNCQLITDGETPDNLCCWVACDGKPPGAWCGSCWWLRKEGEKCDAS